MALQTSGPISLNEIHIEAGGTSGTTCSINDSDIRALIGKGSGVTMSFNEWYGATSSIWQTTMVPGYYEYFASPFDNYPTEVYYGYGPNETGDSLSDTTVDFLSGATVEAFEVKETLDPDTGVSYGKTFQFSVIGTYPNSGWTSMTITGASGLTGTFNRTDFTFAQPSGRTTWLAGVSSTFSAASYTITFK